MGSKQPVIIGGMFGLMEPAGGGQPLPMLLRAPHLALVNARSALRLLTEFLNPRAVWLPAYICAAVTTALMGRDLRFYPLTPTLAAGDGSWLKDIVPGDLVLVVDYFGFPHDTTLAARASEAGAVVVEDACQALLTAGVGRATDYVLASPRKFVGVPDGGLLASITGQPLPPAELASPPLAWHLNCLRAGIQRRAYDEGHADRKWFPMFQSTERDAPIGPLAMSQIAARILAEGIEFAAVAAIRRSNYQLLLDRLGPLALFPDLPDGVVPLCFPVILTDREPVRTALRAAGIFPPVHWPLTGVVPKTFTSSHQLSHRLLSLVCDQRYGAGDMLRIADAIQSEVHP